MTHLSKLDLYHVSHQEGDESTLTWGIFKYLMMPFGLTSAPAVLQALINYVIWDMLNRLMFVYLDDILIFSSTVEEHWSHVWQVLRRLFVNKLLVKAEKNDFHVSTVSFLGFVIDKGQIKGDPV